VLPDHEPKIVESLLILAQAKVRHRSRQPRVEIVGPGLELLLRSLKGSLGTLPDRSRSACLAEHDISERLVASAHMALLEVAQVRLVLLEVALELISTRLTHAGDCRGSSPDAAVSRLIVRASHGVQDSGDQLLVSQLALNLSLLSSGYAGVHPGVVIAGFLDPEGRIAIGGLSALPLHHGTAAIDS